MPAIRRIVTGYPEMIFLEASSAEQIGRSIDFMIGNGIELLVISGGDGTVQAALNHLLANRAVSDLPLLMIIPGGTTNMTALDLGFHGHPVKNLKLLTRQFRHPCPTSLVRRPVLCIRQNTGTLLFGMFFGAGIIADGVEYFQERIKPTGMTGEFASLVVIMRFLFSLLLRGWKAANMPASCRIDGGPEHHGHYTIILASTLNRLLLGVKAHRGTGSGPVHATFVNDGAGGFWRSLLLLIRGRGNPRADNYGYLSCNARTLELFLDGNFVVDGEMFNTQIQHGPLRITATEPVAFLHAGP